MNKQEKQLARWKKIKSKGLISYIIKVGILFYGVAYFLIWVLLAPFIDSSFTFNFIYSDAFNARLIVFGITSPLFGIVVAYIQWMALQRKFD